jgi:hypothetical protein
LIDGRARAVDVEAQIRRGRGISGGRFGWQLFL